MSGPVTADGLSGAEPGAPQEPVAPEEDRGRVALAEISGTELDLAAHVAAVQHAAAGAVATFVGQVRDHDPSVDGAVVALEYSAHPDAPAVLRRLAEDAARTAGVLAVAVTHRTGTLTVGEPAVVVAVATAHRELAFEVCRELVETLKAELPVWKREVLADGSHVWVGSA